METPDQQRARDARHEAAHVVAAVRFGHRFQIVTIEPKDQKRGYVSYPDDWDENPTPERAREIAIIDIAAYVDEELYGLVVDDSALFDKVHAEQILQKAHPDVPSVIPLQDEAWRAARELVRRPEVRAAITALANALLRKETILEEEATAIVKEALQIQQAPLTGKLGWGLLGNEWVVFERRLCDFCGLYETVPNEYRWLPDTSLLLCGDCWEYLQARSQQKAKGQP